MFGDRSRLASRYGGNNRKTFKSEETFKFMINLSLVILNSEHSPTKEEAIWVVVQYLRSDEGNYGKTAKNNWKEM